MHGPTPTRLGLSWYFLKCPSTGIAHGGAMLTTEPKELHPLGANRIFFLVISLLTFLYNLRSQWGNMWHYFRQSRKDIVKPIVINRKCMFFWSCVATIAECIFLGTGFLNLWLRTVKPVHALLLVIYSWIQFHLLMSFDLNLTCPIS